MRYIVESEKSPAQAVADLQESVKRHGFGVLHIYDLKQTLASKGFDLGPQCHILDVCNPKQATEVLTQDISMNVALPCRISVYEEENRTKIGMIRPTAMLSSLSDSPSLKIVAEEVETKLRLIIDDAK